MSSRKNKKRSNTDIAAKMRHEGWELVQQHPVFSSLTYRTYFQCSPLCPQDGWAIVRQNGEIHCNAERQGTPEEWAYVYAHCLLHLGFGHFQVQKLQQREWNVACDLSIAQFLAMLRIGQPPAELQDVLLRLQQHYTLPARTEEVLFEQFCLAGLPDTLLPTGTAGATKMDMHSGADLVDHWGTTFNWQECFAHGLQNAVTDAVETAGVTAATARQPGRRMMTRARKALNWFISSYPLLAALAATFEIIEDAEICQRLQISIAAINMEHREIYINPRVGLSWKEMLFIMAHEMLHAGLRHDQRCAGRDPFLWNVACDYVINGWLVEMGVGEMPQLGVLHDPTLKGESAEAIYDRIATDMRYYRRSMTFRGIERGDMLDEPGWWATGQGTALDEFYRNSLNQGLLLHQEQVRGYLPADLVDEIRSLYQPPIAWDVELAHWFDEHFPPVEKIRTYARASRRQSATPDIPRPNRIPPPPDDQRTFGVLLDTSGSMDRTLLAKALGTIASYSMARDVHAVRVVFCDAATYDQGYMAPEDIAGKVRVRGRGGTVLQPGVNLLEQASDFPETGPLLIITDGFCDRLRIRREHAFLLPAGRSLPFPAAGPIFKMR